jgi:hypothetical protein
MLNTQRVTGLVESLTVHDFSHILDKTMDNLEGLHGDHPSFIQSQSI